MNVNQAGEFLVFLNRLPVASLIAVIGGGGKTSLLEAAEAGRHRAGLCSLVTVTTRLGRWQFPGLNTIESANITEALQALPLAEKGERILLTGPPMTSDSALNKYNGLPLAWFPELRRAAGRETMFLVEADGSAGRPLKAHRAYEPVLPPETDFVVAVIGLSVLIRPWPETVHCPEIMAEYLPLPEPTRPLSPLMVATFIGKAWSRYRPGLIFLNQADLLDSAAGQEAAGQLASFLSGFGFKVMTGSFKEFSFAD